KLVTDEQDNSYRLTEDDARKIQFQLIIGQIIDQDYRITPTGREIIEKGITPLPEQLEPYRESINQLLTAIYSGKAIKPEDERQTVVLNINTNFTKKEFQALWDRISLKTIYEVQFDTEKLIGESKRQINAKLHISE